MPVDSLNNIAHSWKHHKTKVAHHMYVPLHLLLLLTVDASNARVIIFEVMMFE